RTDAGPTLIQFRDEYHRWDGAAWRPVPDSELDAEIARHCRIVFEADYPFRERASQAARESARRKNGKPPGPAVLFTVTTTVKSNTRLNLSGLLNHPDTGADPPFWLDGELRREPAEVIAAPNGLFTLDGIAADAGAFSRPTPQFFTPNALVFPVHRNAPCPETWLRCLGEWFDNDAASIAGLQERFGFLLSSDTFAPKLLFLLGPTRSGKGTLLHVLTELLGTPNVASTTFAALGENFGLEGLLGKRVAVIPDGRLSHRTDL